MKLQKRTVIITFLISLFSLIVATCLEWQCDKLLFSYYIKGHRGFIINLIIGVFASSLLVLITSIINYCSEKRNCLIKYYTLFTKIFVDTDYLQRVLISYKDDSDVFTITESKFSEFTELIGNYKSLLHDIRINNSNFELFIKNKFLHNVFSKITKKNTLLQGYYELLEETDKIYLSAETVYQLWIRVTIPKYKLEFYEGFQTELKKFTPMLGGEKGFTLAYKNFNKHIVRIMKFKEETEND